MRTLVKDVSDEEKRPQVRAEITEAKATLGHEWNYVIALPKPMVEKIGVIVANKRKGHG